jgi:rhodanese-related sulfurtransferase
MPSKKVFRHVLAIIVLSIVVGLAANLLLVRKYIKGEFRQRFLSRDKYPGVTFISLAEAEQLFAQKAATFIDARSQEEYVSGHILGALNLPLNETKKGVAADQLQALSERSLVIYCQGGDCETSEALAKILYESGFKNIKVFQGGWAEWKQAGLPVAEGNGPQ